MYVSKEKEENFILVQQMSSSVMYRYSNLLSSEVSQNNREGLSYDESSFSSPIGRVSHGSTGRGVGFSEKFGYMEMGVRITMKICFIVACFCGLF